MGKKIEECDFRELNSQFLLLENDERALGVIKERFPSQKEDNAVLLYGYIDPNTGLTFEVICCALVSEKGIIFRASSEKKSVRLRYGAIRGEVESLSFLSIFDRFRLKENIINARYNSNEELKDLRNLKYLDPIRHPQHPDDIIIDLVKPGLKPERVWVRLKSIVGGIPSGILLNEPVGNFGCNVGDIVKVLMVQGKSENHYVAQL
ncbi:hypothetical protein ACPWSR_13290 [Alloiococcus sp. CFN-8]|uniref:hypothetical protein n=1 Tax=Alloiococcus sp. CFN-8 TaxID=3416081 RepID=UPI003CF9BC90